MTTKQKTPITYPADHPFAACYESKTLPPPKPARRSHRATRDRSYLGKVRAMKL